MGFELKARIGLDNTPLVAGLEQSKAAVRSFGTSIRSHLGGELAGLKGQVAAAFGAAAITSGIRELIELGGRTADSAARTRLTTDEVQALGYAAEQTGASFEDVATALKKVAIAKQEAMEGNQDRRMDFKRFGIDLEGLRRNVPIGLFSKLADEIQTGELSSERLVSALHLLGKTGDSLFPAFKAGLGDMISRFEELGLAIDPGTIDKLDALGDKLDEVKLFWKKAGAEILNDIDSSFGGTVANIGLLAEGLAEIFAERFKAEVKSEINNEFSSELIAQSLLGGDEDYQASLAKSRELEQRLKRNLQRNREERDSEFTKQTEITGRGGLRKPLEELKQQVARQFDSLARVGGSMQNTDQLKSMEIGKQILTEARIMRKLMEKGNFSNESYGPLI